jgi:hypothetical protein
MILLGLPSSLRISAARSSTSGDRASSSKAAVSMEMGNALATTVRFSYSMSCPRAGRSCSRRASCTKFDAAAGRWKPTRSAPRSPSTMADRHGSWVNSSYGGKGMCRKKPIVRSGRLWRSRAGTSCSW